MKLVVFGLAVSSSWGNGHATIWRGLIRALAERGHGITFFERDQSYYAEHRDLTSLPGGNLVIYDDWDDDLARRAVDGADAVFVTSYCPDARRAAGLLRNASCLRVFYDLDTPVTLERLAAGEQVDYVPDDGLRLFDLVLSYTGGDALERLQQQLGARHVAALYGAVDAEAYHPTASRNGCASRLSHLGTYAPDRHRALERLFVDVAARMPGERFLLAGPLYPPSFAHLPNIVRTHHVPPGEHRAFYASSDFTLNVTRGAMARLGFCPSGRLFEAAACEAAVISDRWSGLETFFEADSELVIVEDTADVVQALRMPEARRRELGRAARARVIACHTAAHRARELEALLTAVSQSTAPRLT